MVKDEFFVEQWSFSISQMKILKMYSFVRSNLLMPTPGSRRAPT
jgi:hypothetical protein